MDSEEGSLKDLLNLRETLQQAIANIPTLSPSPSPTPDDNNSADEEEFEEDFKDEGSTSSDMCESMESAPSRQVTPPRDNSSQASSSRFETSSTMTPPTMTDYNFDLVAFSDRIKDLIKDRPIARLIPSSPRPQDLSLLRIAYSVMQAPWTLSLREPHPPPMDVENKFLSTLHPQEAKNSGPLNPRHRFELQLFWYQERFAQLLEKQQAVIKCLNHETLTNGDQTDRALSLVGETQHNEEQLRFWNLEQSNLIEMAKIVNSIPKSLAARLATENSCSSSGNGIEAFFDDAISTSPQWRPCRAEDSFQASGLRQVSCSPSNMSCSSSSSSREQLPERTLSQEEFLKHLGLISQAALQIHLNTPRKVERRRRAVTANPKYTSNGFVEILQLPTRQTRGKGKQNAEKLATEISSATSVESVTDKEYAKTNEKSPVDMCAVCEKQSCDTFCRNCQSKLHGDCVRMTGSRASTPSSLSRCPVCVQSVCKPPSQDRKPGSTPSSISILNPDKSLRKKKLSGDSTSVPQVSTLNKPVRIAELSKPMRTRSSPLKRTSTPPVAPQFDNTSSHNGTDSSGPPAKIRKTRSSSIVTSTATATVAIKQSPRRKTVCGQQKEGSNSSNISSSSNGSSCLSPSKTPTPINEIPSVTQKLKTAVIPRKMRKPRKPRVRKAIVTTPPVVKKPPVKRKIIAKYISPSPVIESKKTNSKISPKREKMVKSESIVPEIKETPLLKDETGPVVTNEETLTSPDKLSSIAMPIKSYAETRDPEVISMCESEMNGVVFSTNSGGVEESSINSPIPIFKFGDERSMAYRVPGKKPLRLSPKKMSPKKTNLFKCDAISLSMSAAAQSVFLGKKKNPENESEENYNSACIENSPHAATATSIVPVFPKCYENIPNGVKDISSIPSTLSDVNFFENSAMKVNSDGQNNQNDISAKEAGGGFTLLVKDLGISDLLNLDDSKNLVKLNQNTFNSFQIMQSRNLNESEDEDESVIPPHGVVYSHENGELPDNSFIKPSSGELVVEDLDMEIDEYLHEFEAAVQQAQVQVASPENVERFQLPEEPDQWAEKTHNFTMPSDVPGNQSLLQELLNLPATPSQPPESEVMDHPQPLPEIGNNDDDDDDCVVIEEHFHSNDSDGSVQELRDEASSESESEEEEEQEEEEENNSPEEIEELLSIPDYNPPSPEGAEGTPESKNDDVNKENNEDDEEEEDQEEDEEEELQDV